MEKLTLKSSIVGCQTTWGSDKPDGSIRVYIYGRYNEHGDFLISDISKQKEVLYDEDEIGYVDVSIPFLYCGTAEEEMETVLRAARQTVIDTGKFEVGNQFGTLFLKEDD